MKKGLYVIFAFFMTIGLKNYAFGQQEGFVSTLPVSYHIRSSYVVSAFPNYNFTIGATKLFSEKYYESFLKNKDVNIVYDETYALLNRAEVALVTSGTATLEAALIKTPQIVCYKSSWVSYQIGKILLKNLKYISLVNLILNKEVVRELIQGDLNATNLVEELKTILKKGKSNEMIDSYSELENLLDKEGASRETARRIVDFHLESNS